MKKVTNIISCKSGWEGIYLPIINKIMNFDDEQESCDKKIGIKSIKSEDGKLIITVANESNLPQHLANRIKDAELKSLTTCEYCGTKLDVGTTMNYEYITCCRECWEKFILTKNKNSIWKSFKSNKLFKHGKGKY